MLSRERERDREFELEVLAVQLKHERQIVFCSTFIALGAAFVVFSLTTAVTVGLSQPEIPALVFWMIWAYLITGGVLLLRFLMEFARLKTWTRSETERIRRKFAKF